MVSDLLFVVLGIGLAVTIPGFMSALGVGMTGVAAAGATAEKPGEFSRMFVLEILPGTQGFYGFIAGILIMMGTGILGGAFGLPADVTGLVVLAAAVPAILQGFTAYYQGKVATASVSAVSKTPETFGSCVIYTVMVETYAILGFLTAFLLVYGLGIFG
ncbi:hypothetical protein AKJ44_01225 [candidate division MSBL1 archaeon SCGC-AAA261F17]|uniref:V-ATPase proteolipid subunit C-like domain-containing protein n=1 Tax=candidate division MSBL1 archaeon SCGC-AAA261F17 TaxID=1698274 RepID=A0A133V6V3_9EURY|nr:hypothetical protein AKJ44_01225 [candidate division MSBL1 archaeon SCGC-AAA261F17]